MRLWPHFVVIRGESFYFAVDEGSDILKDRRSEWSRCIPFCTRKDLEAKDHARLNTGDWSRRSDNGPIGHTMIDIDVMSGMGQEAARPEIAYVTFNLFDQVDLGHLIKPAAWSLCEEHFIRRDTKNPKRLAGIGVAPLRSGTYVVPFEFRGVVPCQYSFGQKNNAHRLVPADVVSDGAAAAKHLVIGMRGDHENSFRHFSTAHFLGPTPPPSGAIRPQHREGSVRVAG